MSPFVRVPDPTNVKVTCHKALVLRTDVKDFIMAQVRDAGLENWSISVEGQASANTFTVKLEGELQRCCRTRFQDSGFRQAVRQAQAAVATRARRERDESADA